MDSKDLSVYINWESAGKIFDHLVMSKKKTVESKLRRGMTFSQTKTPNSSVSMDEFKYLFNFIEKNRNKGSLNSKFRNKIQTAISGTEHTVTTNKKKIVHRKLISNPSPCQKTVAAPIKRINTRQNNDQPSCPKTLDMENSGGNPFLYARKETPQPINHERSEDRLKRKDQETKKQHGTVYVTKQDCRKGSSPKPAHCIRRGIRLLQQIRWQAGPHQRNTTAPKKQSKPPTKVYIKEKI